MEDVNVLITYITGGKNPTIAGFWKDKDGKERAALEPVYKTNCFGITVTDGEECMHALKRIGVMGLNLFDTKERSKA